MTSTFLIFQKDFWLRRTRFLISYRDLQGFLRNDLALKVSSCKYISLLLEPILGRGKLLLRKAYGIWDFSEFLGYLMIFLLKSARDLFRVIYPSDYWWGLVMTPYQLGNFRPENSVLP